jgi:SAM-dependent methyltransferase
VDVSDLVRQLYAGDDLETGIVASLAAAGVDPDHITVQNLAAVDQLHAGFSAATLYLQEQLDLTPQSRLLDVGCGIGGPARMAAADYGCAVIGVDLSPDFVRAATTLTARVGLSDLVEFRVGTGERLGFAAGSFDRAMMVHVGMNIPDKAAVFAEIRRVLQPGGTFGLFEQMLTSEAELVYPLPWAEDRRSSFLVSPDEYARDLRAAGFTIDRTEDRTAATARIDGPPSQLSPAAVFGPPFMERIANNIAATRAGALAPVLMIATAS